MPSARSKLEYNVIPFAEVDHTRPITQVVEMNDGYQILLYTDSPKNKKLYASNSQDERGGIQANEFENLDDFLIKEFQFEKDADGNWLPTTDYHDNEQTVEQAIAGFSSPDSIFLENGVLEITKLAGNFRDPEMLFFEFFGADDDGDDDEDED